MLNNLLTTLHMSLNTTLASKKKILNHWIVERVTAVFLIPSIFFLLYSFITATQATSFDVYNCTNLLFLFLNISSISVSNYTLLKQIYVAFIFAAILIHLVEGLENVIHDYLHYDQLKKIIFIFIKCLQLFVLKCLIVYIMFF